MTQSLGGTFTFPGTSLTVRRMGYGAMQLAGPGVFGPPRDHDEAVAVLREAIASGVDHIDTSDFYGPHVVNKLIKEALHPFPKNLVIVSKLGAKRGADASWNPAFSPEELESAARDNLRHLGIDALDIVNLRIMGDVHAPQEGSIADKVEIMANLQRKGLIKHIGLSNVTSKQVAEARSIVPIVCVQNFYNVANRNDDPLVDEMAAAGIAFVPFFPLGGFFPLQTEALATVATKLGATQLQVAQAWLLQRAPNMLLIPGTSSRGHLRENLASAELKLPADALDQLNVIAAQAKH
ncbi:MAG TPA: aldo/keto reductase family oxidoreductase [Rhizomicrobium sp.]|nr:aldo/keto reductase family oxidoreductase [Rhizomicrobium sp.]